MINVAFWESEPGRCVQLVSTEMGEWGMGEQFVVVQCGHIYALR